MSSYGGNLTLKHVQQVFPKKSRGEQADIHEEFGESTSNAEELKAAYIKKYGSLRESVKLTRGALRSLIKEELTRISESNEPDPKNPYIPVKQDTDLNKGRYDGYHAHKRPEFASDDYYTGYEQGESQARWNEEHEFAEGVLREDRHGGGHTVGNGPTFTGAGPGAHPPQGFYDPKDPDSDQHGITAGELGFEHGSSGVKELDGLGLAKAGYRDADDLIAYQNGYDQGQIDKGKPQ